MERKVRIIVSDTDRLHPPVWGGAKRIWNLYSNLSQDKFNIDYVGFDSFQKRLKVNKLPPNFREFLIPSPDHYRKLWSPLNKRYFKDLRLDLFVYLMMSTVKEFGRAFRQLKADILISSHPWAAPSMKKKKGQLFIYDAHNCEYRLMRALTKRHLLGDIISLWVRKIEHEACRKSDIIIVCSNQEKNDLINLYRVKEKKIHIVPNGAIPKPFYSVEEKEGAKEKLAIGRRKTVTFIGSYYDPNIQAVRFILDRLAAELKEYIFLIGGSVKYAFGDRVVSDNIKFYGTLSEDELDIILKASDIAINPVLIGSGINIKMLDYMSYGLPIVTTECGARGINVDSKMPMIISDLRNFADNIRRLSGDLALYLKMAEDARFLVNEKYSWKIISSDLERLILSRL